MGGEEPLGLGDATRGPPAQRVLPAADRDLVVALLRHRHHLAGAVLPRHQLVGVGDGDDLEDSGEPLQRGRLQGVAELVRPLEAVHGAAELLGCLEVAREVRRQLLDRGLPHTGRAARQQRVDGMRPVADVVTVGKEPSTSWSGLKSAIGKAMAGLKRRAIAATAGCRVTGFVTAVASCRVVVAEAAIASFPGAACCVGIRTVGGTPEVCAPHGFDDLFAFVLRPNPVQAPRAIYEALERGGA